MNQPTILITGGHGGIGQAVCKRFLRGGYAVTAPDSKELDLNDIESIKRYTSENIRDFDAFVHCAGINPVGPFEAAGEEILERTMRVNVFGFLALCRTLVPGMRRRKVGWIVAISSLYGSLSRRGRLPYTASKHALEGAVKCLAIELAPDGILVNCVAPGFVMTRMTRQNNSEERLRELTAGIPLGRMMEPEEIAEAVWFLGTGVNRGITGQTLSVDGGYSIGGFQHE